MSSEVLVLAFLGLHLEEGSSKSFSHTNDCSKNTSFSFHARVSSRWFHFPFHSLWLVEHILLEKLI